MTNFPRGLRTLAPAALVAAALLLSTVPAVAQDGGPIRIAVVDLERLVASSKLGQDLQNELRAFEEQVKAEGQTKQDALADLRKRLAEGANSLTDDKLAELQKQFEDATIDLRRFRDDKQREGQKIQAEGLRKIEQQMEPVFEKIRDEEGYDLILNYVPGVVVMANERVDITPKVLERLNGGA